MGRKILVTYASKYGATAEIAGKIGDVLRQAGLQVELCPVSVVRDLASYQAVILGSGVYIGQWNKQAEAFVIANEKALADRQVWLFSSGPTGEGDPAELLQGWRLPDGLRPAADRIQPRDIAVFHGFINPNKLDFFTKLVLKGMKKPFGDFRDWNAIISWADKIAATMKASS